MASLDMDCVEFDRFGAAIESEDVEEPGTEKTRMSEQDVQSLIHENVVEIAENTEIIGREIKLVKGDDLQLAVIVQPEDEVNLDASMLTSGTTQIVHLGSSDGDQISILTNNTHLLNGQVIQLPDGTTAVVRHGFQMIQLPDGTSALLPSGLFVDGGIDGSQLGLEQVDGQEEDEQESAAILDQEVTDLQNGVPDCDLVSGNRSQPMKDNGVNDMAAGEGESSVNLLSHQDGRISMGKTFKCNFEACGRLYTTQHHLKVHMRSHTGDRPFRCDFNDCNKAFATGYGLKSHRRIHTGEKPYPCVNEQCDKAFKTSGDLQKHMRTHTGERPFICPYKGCNRSFTTSNIRKVHIRTHTGERPYTCDVKGCGKTFASATNYKNHIRIHSGEKPYECSVYGCGKRFTEYSSLYKHHVVHTHTKPYPCELCGKTYRQTSTLAMHKRVAHGDESVGDDGEFVGVLVESGGQTACAKPSPGYRIIENCPRGPDEADGNLVIDTSEVNNQGNLVSSTPTILHQLPSTISISGAGSGNHVLVITDPSQLEVIQQISKQGN